jgi:hypothetical protein
VVEAEHRPQRLRARLGLGDALLIEVVAEDVDAIGAGEVVEPVAVEVGQRHARRGLHEAAGAEMLADQAAVLEWDPVGLGELQVGNLRGRLRGGLAAPGEATLEGGAEPEEGVLPLRSDFGRSAIGREEIVDVELVVRDQPRHPARHLRVSGQGPVLGPRQFKARLELGGDRCRRGDDAGRKRQHRNRCIHVHQR